MGVRNGSGAATTLTITADHVVSDENGCTNAERLEPGGCRAGPGQLAKRLVFHVAVAATEHGRYTPRWSGTGAQLSGSTLVVDRLARAGTVWVTVAVSLPRSVGNEVQSDTFGFGLLVTLEGGGVSASAGVDGVSASTSGHGGLAVTGTGLGLIVTGGLLLLATGYLVLDSARPRRRRRGAPA